MRRDLLSLTPEALAALSNRGLVKRAQGELEAGPMPSLSEGADGTVVAEFADGAVARLPPTTPLADCPCSCGSDPICRHRVAAVLVYRSQSPSPESAAVPLIANSQLEAVLGTRILARAERVRRRGLVAMLVESAGDVVSGGPAAGLHGAFPVRRPRTCALRLRVGRCLRACSARGVWALAALPANAALPVSIQLGTTSHAAADIEGLTDVEAFIAEMLEAGVEQSARQADRLRWLRRRVEERGLIWVALVLEDLERLFEAYAARSTLYDDRELVELLLEAGARVRAARSAAAELPPAVVLGQNRRAETPLDGATLISLGASIAVDQRRYRAQVFLADPDNATVMALTREWALPKGASEPDASARRVAPGITLSALAHGQLVVQSAVRRANLALALSGKAGASPVLSLAADFSRLPDSLCVRSFAELESRLRSWAPRFVRPRAVADSVFALEVAAVEAIAYRATHQELSAWLRDASGAGVRLALRHRSAVPLALDAASAALEAGVRFACGRVRLASGSGPVLEPTGLWTGRDFVVPDLDAPPPNARRMASPPTSEDSDPTAAALRNVGHLLAEVARAGLRRRPLDADAARLSASCGAAGLQDVAARVEALARVRSPGAWLDAGIRWSLVNDA